MNSSIKTTSSFIISLFVFFQLNAQHITFEKRFGGPTSHYGGSVLPTIIQTPDGGYMMSIEYEPFLITHSLFKLDRYGDLQWSKMISPPGQYYDWSLQCWQIFSRSPNKYDIIGYFNHNSMSWSSENGIVYSIDSSGNYLNGLRHQYPGRADTLNNGIISVAFYQTDIVLLRYDSTGNLLLNKRYGTTDAEYSQKVIHTNDNGYLISGNGDYNGDKLVLIKTDSAGNILWNKQLYNPNENYSPCGAIQTSDSSIYILGGIQAGPILKDFIIIKMDNSGNVLFTKQYSTPNIFSPRSFFQTKDNALVVSALNGGGLVKLDLNGNVIWAKNYLGSAIPTLDSGIAILKYANDTLAPVNKISVIKTDPWGNSCTPVSSLNVTDSAITITDYPTTFTVSSVATITPSSFTPVLSLVGGEETDCLYNGISSEEKQSSLIKLYPNPFTNELNVYLENRDLAEISIYDMMARRIFNDSFKNSISINTERLAKGLYFYEVRDKNGVIYTGKAMKD